LPCLSRLVHLAASWLMSIGGHRFCDLRLVQRSRWNFGRLLSFPTADFRRATWLNRLSPDCTVASRRASWFVDFNVVLADLRPSPLCVVRRTCDRDGDTLAELQAVVRVCRSSAPAPVRLWYYGFGALSAKNVTGARAPGQIWPDTLRCSDLYSFSVQQ
jgi:hypothetical protein